MHKIQLEKLEEKEIISGFRGKFVYSDKMTLAFRNIKMGSIAPEHSHKHEQTLHVIKEKIELTMGGKSEILKEGSVVLIKSYEKHEAKALTDCKIIDIFIPPGEITGNNREPEVQALVKSTLL